MDIKSFRKSKLKRRTSTVDVPSMSDFFDEGCEPKIKVHSLTGTEVAKARMRVQQNAAVSELMSKLVSDKINDKLDGIKEVLGLSDNVPDDAVYRIAVLEFGIDGIEFTQEDCVKLHEHYPEAFYSLTSKILELTGLGSVQPGELSVSGQTKE